MPIDFNRMKNIFGAPGKSFQQATQQMPYTPPPQPLPDENINAYVEEPIPNRSLERFLAMEAPTRGNPNILSKIGATMMSLKHSPDDVDKALHAPYYQKQQEYNQQAEPLLKGAQIEATQENNRSLADYRNTLGATSQIRAQTGQTNAGANVMRAETAKMLAGMPNVRVKLGRGGQPDVFFDAKSGKTLYSSPSGTMDPELKFKMEQEGRVEIQDMQDDAAMDRTLVHEAGANQRDLTPNPGTAPSATQIEQQVENRAADLIRQNPKIGEWLHKNPNTGQWEVDAVKEPGFFGGGNGLTEEIRNQLVEFLRSGKPPSQQGTVPPPSGVPMTGGSNPVNASPIGGTPDAGLTGVNTGFTKPGGIQLSRPPGDPNNPMGFGQSTQPGQVMRKTQTHTSGAKRTLISRDGGKTWVPE